MRGVADMEATKLHSHSNENRLRQSNRFMHLTHFTELSSPLEKSHWIWFCATKECLEWYGAFGQENYTISIPHSKPPETINLGDPMSWPSWIRQLRWGDCTIRCESMVNWDNLYKPMLPMSDTYDTSDVKYLIVPYDRFAFDYEEARWIAQHHFTEWAPGEDQVQCAKQASHPRMKCLEQDAARLHLQSRCMLMRTWIDREALDVMDALHRHDSNLQGWRYDTGTVLGLAPVAKCSTLAEREAAVAAVAAADTVCILFYHLPEYLLSREFVNTARRYTR
jgi:hypothetical protein